jgi:hypothetical protein
LTVEEPTSRNAFAAAATPAFLFLIPSAIFFSDCFSNGVTNLVTFNIIRNDSEFPFLALFDKIGRPAVLLSHTINDTI